MIPAKLPKIVLVLLISLIGLTVAPAAALAGPAKSSLSPRGGSSMCRISAGTPLTRSPGLLHNSHPGPLRRIPASAVLPKTPVTRALIPGDRCDLLAPKSLRSPLARQLYSASSGPRVLPPPKPPVNRPVSSTTTNQILAEARSYLGTPYRSGGSLETSRATDCSGFVQYIYQKSHIDLPRSSNEQAQTGAVVTRTLDFAKLLPGDLLFFGQGGRHIGHVGIYMGDGKMIHCASRRGVIISDLDDPYHAGTFVVAKRLPEVQSPRNAHSETAPPREL